jgi:hypothetical protein
VDWQAEGEEVRQEFEDDVCITNTRVIKVKESFSAFSSESITLAHLSMVFAYKRRRVWLIVAGIVLLTLFTVLYLATMGSPFAYTPPLVSTLNKIFLGFSFLAVILIILGIVLGPKVVRFEADSGSMITFKPANASEIEEALKWFGTLRDERTIKAT